jgi:hypothetical protein
MKTIEFEIVRDSLIFKDAIVLPDDHALTAEQIEAMKQKRFDDWYAIVTAPAPEPSDEKLFPPLQPPEPDIIEDDTTEESLTEESVTDHSIEE